MAVVGFLLIMPASVISDRLGRKWTIVPSCIAIASACVLMAATGADRVATAWQLVQSLVLTVHSA
jgi:MFS family permease